MKKTHTLGILMFFAQVTFAQDSKLWVALSAGSSIGINNNQPNMLGNGFNIEGSAFIPLQLNQESQKLKSSRFTVGINLAVNYSNLNNLAPDNQDVANQYQLYNGSVAVNSVLEAEKSASFAGLAGLQATASFGKVSVSPSLNLCYLHLEKDGYVQTGTSSINGQPRQLDLVKAEAQNVGGFVFKPQLKVAYRINSKLSFFVSSAALMSQKNDYSTKQLVPQGGFNEKRTYEAQQLINGSWEDQQISSRYGTIEINAGISFGLGSSSKRKIRGKVTKPGDNGMNNTNSFIEQQSAKSINEKGIKRTEANERQTPNTSFGQRLNAKTTPSSTENPDSSAANNKEVNPLYNGNATEGNNPLYGQKSVSQQTQDKTFGEKVAQGQQPASKSINEKGIKRADAAMASPGSPIGGIVVKGGKNPGGNMRLVSNSNGEITLNHLQKGNYSFQLSSPSTEKSISEKGVKRSESTNLVSGNPIGGIIVKGGKNPGGNYINLTVNDKGEIGFEVLESGNYKLIITNGTTTGSKEKVVEKATSGLKDTLKTNV